MIFCNCNRVVMGMKYVRMIGLEDEYDFEFKDKTK